MTEHKRLVISISLIILVFLISSLAGSTSSAKSDQLTHNPPLLYESLRPATQEISSTETFLDVAITDEGMFPSVLWITPATTIRWTNQTSQTQRLEGIKTAYVPDADPEAGSGGSTILYLPLIFKGNSDSQSNDQANGNSPTPDTIWQSGDIAPGDSFTYVFDQSGYYVYALAGSPTLTGMVVVEQPMMIASRSSAPLITVTSDDRTNNGNCTLREAIIAANKNIAIDACQPGSSTVTDTILLGVGTYALTIPGQGEDAAATGDLDIYSAIEIVGSTQGPTIIDASGLSDRVFHILKKGKLTISNVTITRGSGSYGGGLYNVGTLTLNNSSVLSNTASDSYGGGLKNEGTAKINGSTFSGNSAEYGGGIYNRANLTVNNSTISGNTAEEHGGGIKNEGTLRLNNNTISANTAQDKGGGISNFGYGKVYFKNTIIAGNIASHSEQADCDYFNTDSSLGYNLVGNGTGCPTTGTDLTVDPGQVFAIVLGPLQDNGGPTQTHALLLGSPAIDAIPLNKCLFNADQRGLARPQGTACDIGSFEFEDVHIFTVNSTADTDDGKCDLAGCTLREAINAANAHPNGAVLDEIRFNIPGSGVQTIQPASALPSITGAVTIDGTTQAGASCNPVNLNLLIALNGANAGANANGLNISAGNSTVRGLIISGFQGTGIELSGNGSNIIRCNTITSNGGDGVRVTSSTGNAIGGTGILTDVNRIFSNTGLGIDLAGDAVTPNDAGDPDPGANNLQNFPTISDAIPDNGNVRLSGLLNSTANTSFNLEFFANSSCDASGFGEGQILLGTSSVATNENGNAVFTDLSFSLSADTPFITSTATDANGNTSEFSECVMVSLANISWPRALSLNLNGNPRSATFDQLLDRQGQSRWFRFNIQPNSKVIVTLTNLPANYDLTIYKDNSAAFDELNSPQDLIRLNAEFAPDALAFDAFAAGARTPDTFAAGARTPDAFAPAAFSAEVFAAGARTPDAFAAGARTPDAFAAGARTPDIFAPDAFAQDAFAAGARTPDDIAAGARTEDFFQTFASAQTRSLIGVSAFNGTVGEGIIVNTWNNTGNFYVRVKGRDGAFSLAAPFRLQVTVEDGACNNVTANLPGTSLNAAANNYRTIILTDLGRMPGDPDLAAMQTRLANLAARPEVAGVVVDVGADARVAEANARADTNFRCPYAKNLVASSIKAIVERYRDQNPSLQYVVIVGNDDVIPFFRYPDNTLLGNEMEYVPPVFDNTASQASLRLGYVLSQDAYGSRVDVSLRVNEFPIPDLAVGRLVERAADINRVIDAYLATPNGVVNTPTRSLITGYDFLVDAANAVQSELEAGIGTAADTLITPANLSPQDPTAWTGADLAQALLGSRHDVVFLAGHFSASSALAADYTTRLITTDLVASPVNLTNAIIFSAGCHSGYNIVNNHGIPNVTVEPDWAQAFAQKGATFIGGTGYQYGDTDIIEYNERIYLEFSRQLRLGSGPVSIGQALMASKRVYLAQTPELRGLHEKSVLQPTLFGLPMLSVNMPGQRFSSNNDPSIVGGTDQFSANPGAALGLRFANVNIENLGQSLTEQTVPLVNTEGEPNVEARYLQGGSGVVSHPLEPTLPLELRNVTVPGQVLRGVGFLGGSFTDIPNVLPLTGAATTEIRAVHSTFISDNFYPIQPWSVNYFEALSNGATRLAVTPAQHGASSPGAQTATLRRFNSMNFRLYYSNNIGTVAVGDNDITPALAAAPAIVGISATPDGGGNVIFRIKVVGDPTAGIQEVWVTYTGVTGPFAGTWQSLDLSQNVDDSTLWEGVLSLNGTAPGDVRFMVQATNGVGLVNLVTNLGAYYIPGVDPALLQPTALSLEPPGTSSPRPYGTNASFSAVLTLNGQPLANRIITFGLGPSSRQVFTDGNGRASATLPLLALPGEYEVTASFAGFGQEAPSLASNTFNFTITKQSTSLTLNPSSATGHPDDDALMVATLTDAEGRRLAEQTVFFVVSGSGGTYSVAVITDYLGRAALGNIPLPNGTYTVNAYFNGTIPLGNNNTVNLSSDRYNPSTAAGSLALNIVCGTILDDFNRPEKQLGNNWAGSRAPTNYKIVNGQVQVLKGGPVYWKEPAFGPTQEACLTLTQLDDHGHYSVLLKVQQRNWRRGAIDVFYNAQEQVVGVEIFVPKGEFERIATFPMTLQNGAQLAGRALADGTVEIYVNGQLVGQTNAGPFFVNKGGYIGMWLFGSADEYALVDNFAGR